MMLAVLSRTPGGVASRIPAVSAQAIPTTEKERRMTNKARRAVRTRGLAMILLLPGGG
jgi:hypothetical protein